MIRNSCSCKALIFHQKHKQGQELNPNIAVFQHYDKFVDEDDIIRGFEFEEKIFVSREEEPPMFVTTPNGKPDPGLNYP